MWNSALHLLHSVWEFTLQQIAKITEDSLSSFLSPTLRVRSAPTSLYFHFFYLLSESFFARLCVLLHRFPSIEIDSSGAMEIRSNPIEHSQRTLLLPTWFAFAFHTIAVKSHHIESYVLTCIWIERMEQQKSTIKRTRAEEQSDQYPCSENWILRTLRVSHTSAVCGNTSLWWTCMRIKQMEQKTTQLVRSKRWDIASPVPSVWLLNFSKVWKSLWCFLFVEAVWIYTLHWCKCLSQKKTITCPFCGLILQFVHRERSNVRSKRRSCCWQWVIHSAHDSA